jgi:C-terminal processing protease CtpA/Prc
LGGYGIKATTLQISTPKGNSINHIGIQPDIATDEDALDYALKLTEATYTNTEDSQ